MWAQVMFPLALRWRGGRPEQSLLQAAAEAFGGVSGGCLVPISRKKPHTHRTELSSGFILAASQRTFRNKDTRKRLQADSCQLKECGKSAGMEWYEP